MAIKALSPCQIPPRPFYLNSFQWDFELEISHNRLVSLESLQYFSVVQWTPQQMFIGSHSDQENCGNGSGVIKNKQKVRQEKLNSSRSSLRKVIKEERNPEIVRESVPKSNGEALIRKLQVVLCAMLKVILSGSRLLIRRHSPFSVFHNCMLNLQIVCWFEKCKFDTKRSLWSSQDDSFSLRSCMCMDLEWCN